MPLVVRPGVAILHGPLDGLPITVSAFVTSGGDMLFWLALAGGSALIILWRHWRAAKHLQVPKEMGAC